MASAAPMIQYLLYSTVYGLCYTLLLSMGYTDVQCDVILLFLFTVWVFYVITKEICLFRAVVQNVLCVALFSVRGDLLCW